MLSFAFLPQLTQHVLEVPIPFNAYCIYAIFFMFYYWLPKKRACFVNAVITFSSFRGLLKGIEGCYI
jgi:uncharacterized BrkB/YihY/UPF0761 family membrane protein